MPPIIIPEYRKQYTMGQNEVTQTLAEIRQEVITQITNIPPILARGLYDSLIDVDIKTEPISVKWNKENIDKWDTSDLMMIRNHLTNRLEMQKIRY